MRVANIVFEAHGVSTNIHPATSENAAYAEALEELTAPYKLALTVNKMSSDTADKIMAEVYAKTVVLDYDEMDEEEWVEWFLAHPAEFDETIHIAEHPQLWEDMSHGG